MKLTALLIMVFTVTVSATSFSQNKINFKGQKTEISKAIAAIESQTSYRFLYNEGLKEIRKKITVNLADASVEDALNTLFKNTDLSYQLLENQLIIIKGDNIEAADQIIIGKVTDEKGEALIGVSVKIKGTNRGVSTNINGQFSIDAPTDATLVFTYIGFQTKEVKVGGQKSINVILSQTNSQLNEVVVVGYGTQRKASLTTAVASVGGEDIAERGTVSPLQAVQGQVAGVDITASSGRAGANFTTTIRGQNSLAGGSPLYVVDGVIVSDVSFLNPQDIAKMDVLKDAASTAIYGSRGSNGVIIVTTKTGTSARSSKTLSYEGYTGVRAVSRMPDFMSGDQWAEFRLNAYIVPELDRGSTNYSNKIGGFENPVIAGRVENKDYTNWRDLVLQNGIQSNHYLSFSGGANNINYLLGAGYQNEEGNLINENFRRYNIKGSFDSKISERWSTGLSINLALSELERGSDLSVTNAFRMAPIFSPYDDAGNLTFRPGQIFNPSTNATTSITSSVNPLLDNANSQNNTRRTFGLSNIYLQYKPASWLQIRSTFSPQVNVERNGRYSGSLTESRGGQLASAQRADLQKYSYIFDNVLTAKKEFKGGHAFELTALYSQQLDRTEVDTTVVADLPYNSSYHNIGSAGRRERNESFFYKETLQSYMLRLNYSINNKYLFSFVNRWDGSSKLAPGHKWAAFPSASAAWRLTEEAFLKKYTFISDLKLRFSAGIAGNNNNITPYGTQMNLGSPAYYDFGGALALGFNPNRLPNRSLSWERTREYDLGLDYGFLRGRISGSIDVYDKLSKDVILDRELAFENGWAILKDNVSSVGNRGIEFSLRTTNISTKNLTWTTSINFARNKNAIKELLDGKVDLPGNKWFIGQPINVNYTFVFDGIWQQNEVDQAKLYSQTPGQAKVIDFDNNRIIDNNDRRIIGQVDPKWTGGFSTQLTYKGFDFSTSLFTRQGMQVLSRFHEEFTNLADRGRTKLNVNYYMRPNLYTTTRESNTYPQPQNPGPYWASVGYYKDNSFVKVQNILLGYTLPDKLSQRIKARSLRLYANILNPFIWTDYDGFDPEYAGQNLLNTGVSSTTYQIGVNVKF
ncbi:TonB-dependent receptor [Desertivirga brevis]|uniref:TonB-dependent receptor n=1 Tax=Desertivirga brevis TaxID=2810310 RepID=UPI001A96C28E|nr:TonB-dependent receptor [Pedobacter sp. SYSU D00873]